MSGQRLFISHANEDAAIAERIVAYLEARGVPCWISSRDIPPRAIYADAITEAVQACSACAVVLSKASNQSKAVKRELELTSHYDKPFIPIRIDATEPAAGVDYYLRNTQWLDYKRDGERALDRIVTQVQGAPMPPAPAARRRQIPLWPALVVGGLLTLGAGGWYAWTQFGPQSAPNQAASVSGETLAPLLGSYNWEGLECGRGPTITYEGSALVFTMPDTPTYRHQVLSATRLSGDFALEAQTRVSAPADHAGETYALRLSGDTLQVTADEGTDTWSRCRETERDTNTPVRPRALPQAERARQEQAQRVVPSLVGSWSGILSIEDAYNPVRVGASWTFNSDHSYQDGGARGTWSQNGVDVSWTTDDSHYVGRIAGDTISGTWTNTRGSQGTFRITRN